MLSVIMTPKQLPGYLPSDIGLRARMISPDEAAGELDLGDPDAAAEQEDVVVATLDQGRGKLQRQML